MTPMRNVPRPAPPSTQQNRRGRRQKRCVLAHESAHRRIADAVLAGFDVACESPLKLRVFIDRDREVVPRAEPRERPIARERSPWRELPLDASTRVLVEDTHGYPACAAAR